MNEVSAAYSPFPLAEFKGRWQRVRAAMDEAAISQIIVSGRENVIYLSGLQTIGWSSKHRPVAVIIAAKSEMPTLVVPESLIDVARASTYIDEILPWGEGNISRDCYPTAVEAISAAVSRTRGSASTVGLELGYGTRPGMTFGEFESLRASLDGFAVVDASQTMWKVRQIKSDHEISALRRACAATDAAYDYTFSQMHAGMTEREIAGLMYSRMGLETGETPAFVMVRSGVEKYGMYNVPPFDRVVNHGEIVVIDAGASYKDYVSDFMRMAVVGEPSAEQRRFYEAVRAAQAAGVDAITQGVSGGHLFEVCQRTVAERGLGEHARFERVGHGIGLDMHEPPSLGRGSDALLETNMVVTMEPIFCDVPNHVIGNFALEDLVLVTDGSPEILSNYPRDLVIVD